MLHRFEDRDRNVAGLNPQALRKALSYLRKNNFKFISLAELFTKLAAGVTPFRGDVAFTLDDGYFDQAEIAGPVFAEFDCPATTFATTAFVDGDLWMWWDKVEYIFHQTKRKSLNFTFGHETLAYQWIDKTQLNRVQAEFVQRCKLFVDADRLNLIERFADFAEVALPPTPPPAYAPLTWDIARKWEARGMSFGPHTVTHPILSLIEDEQAEWEINESWKRLKTEVMNPVPVFCYPNGQSADFGFRETGLLKKAGLVGAVVGEPGYVDVASYQKGTDGPYRICRMSFPESLSDVIQYVSGIERTKQLIRRCL
jgi:peptidoglycan/xylan/chitin deacetylase (PgdA/CDA1 family)